MKHFRVESRTAPLVWVLWSCTAPLAESSETVIGRDGDDSSSEEESGASRSLQDGSEVAESAPGQELPGEVLVVEVPDEGRGYVDLAHVEQVEIEDAQDSTAWDIVFDGWDIYTNSGPSGPGQAAAFGPNDASDFLSGQDPSVPFMREDTSGGAFTDWYYYDDETHSLWSRLHTYGIRDGEELFKIQILSYYGEQRGAPVSALYSLRYAPVDDHGSGEIVELQGVDATAGGTGGGDAEPSGCVDLGKGEVLLLSPDEKAKSEAWDICFRRDTITTNGGAAGPGNVTGVDLNADETEEETLEQLQELTSESELERFSGIDFDDLTASDLSYESDGPVSIFGDVWYQGEGEGVEPAEASWLVQAADGKERFLIVISAIDVDDDGDKSIEVRIRPLARD